MPKKSFFLSLLFLGILFIAISFFFPSAFSFFRNIFWIPGAYISEKTLEGSLHIQETFSLFTSLSTLKEENEKFFSQNSILKQKEALYTSLEAENHMLREQLQLPLRGEYTVQTATIISFDPSGAQEWILIKKGSEERISEGMPVIVPENTFIGSVEEVFPHRSRVRLITHPEEVVSVETQRFGTRGIAHGDFGSGILLDTVSEEALLESGDEVFTSTLSEKTPPGLFVGSVGEVHASEDGLFQSASLISPVSFRDLSFVSVIISL